MRQSDDSALGFGGLGMRVTWPSRRLGAAGVALSLVAGLSGLGAPGRASAANETGGTLTVLEGAGFAGNWPEGLAPTTNINALANQTMMNAIYGMLFELLPSGKTVGDLASGYKLSRDAKTLTIDIRRGVTFTDGTPFNAKAVASNFKADLASSSPAKPTFPIASITTPNTHTVVLHLKSADGAIVNQFQDSLFNWIASPTAEAKMGQKAFSLKPVGAGPFKVATDTIGTKLVLTRNPTYWEKGKPYLDSLVFQTTNSDNTALDAMKAGSAQAYEYMGSPNLVGAFKSAGYKVEADKGNAAGDVELNTQQAPFDNMKARLAIYDATDPQVISQKVYGGTCATTESFTGPGGMFFEPKVPGYPTYDPAKAKALVRQLGGLSFTMLVPTLGTRLVEAEALQTMYQAVGMKVKVGTYADLASLIQDYQNHNWQLVPLSVGAWDPADAIGVGFFLHSGATYTGIDDPKVDSLIDQGLGSSDIGTRKATYAQLAEYLVQKAYLPFLCSATTWDITDTSVHGPGLTTQAPGGDVGPEVFWQDVSVTH